MRQGLIERSGLLRESAPHRVDFLHNTLRDYLAAGRLVDLGEVDQLAEHADDDSWQPVILFAMVIGKEVFATRLVQRLLTDTEAIPDGSPRSNAAAAKRARRLFLYPRWFR